MSEQLAPKTDFTPDLTAQPAALIPHASDSGNLSRDIASNRGGVLKATAIVAGGAGLAAVLGGEITFAQGTTGTNPDNCASPIPSAIVTESAMPSASAVVENPNGSIDVFVSPSPVIVAGALEAASPIPDASPILVAQASITPEPSPIPCETPEPTPTPEPITPEDIISGKHPKVKFEIVKKAFEKFLSDDENELARKIFEEWAGPYQDAIDNCESAPKRATLFMGYCSYLLDGSMAMARSGYPEAGKLAKLAYNYLYNGPEIKGPQRKQINERMTDLFS